MKPMLGQKRPAPSVLRRCGLKTGTLDPDVILLEWELTGEPADGLLAALRALGLRSKVIVLRNRPESETAALAAGAVSCCAARIDKRIESKTSKCLRVLVRG